MKARVIQVGNSTGVIIPSSLVKSLKLKKGDTLSTHVDPKSGVLYLSKGAHVVVDEAFIRRVEAFSEQYKADLARLAE